MAKDKGKRKKGRHARGMPPLMGEGEYTCELSTSYSDVDNDGWWDVSVDHGILLNDTILFECQLNWYGIPSELKDELIKHLKSEGISEDDQQKSRSFRSALNYWTKLVKVLRKINKAGHKIMDDAVREGQGVVDERVEPFLID
jgi:hypothetical protein